MRSVRILVALGWLVIAGCDNGPAPTAAPTPPPGAPTLQTQLSAGPPGGVLPGTAGPSVNKQDPAAAPQTSTDPTAVKAGVGVGAAGSRLKNETGILVEPAKALFATKERVVFEIQIPQALQLFQATEGRTPNSQQEFMDKIVTANQIQLPRLPQGREYFYDVQRGELMVRAAK